MKENTPKKQISLWLRQIITIPEVTKIVTYRVCWRTYTLLIPMLKGQAPVLVIISILDECRLALFYLFDTVPESPSPTPWITIGADEEYQGTFRKMGAKSLKDIEEELDKRTVAKLMIDVCTELSLNYKKLGQNYMASSCDQQVAILKEWLNGR